MEKKIIVTGGCGFIGSALIRHIITRTQHKILNLDKLTYAGNTDSLLSVKDNLRYSFKKADICDHKNIKKIILKFKPDIIIHLAAETHVDRSIDNSKKFIESNILGTYLLLEESKNYWLSLKGKKKKFFRFHHVTTDEVFGDLDKKLSTFSENSPYKPSSPYSASKASSDHLVRAWHRTYNLPTLITNCSNNYGPYQFPEKLIPLVIMNAIKGRKIPIYGNGKYLLGLFLEELRTRKILIEAIKKYELIDQKKFNSENEYSEAVEKICFNT